MEVLDKALQEKWPLLSMAQKESIINLIDGCLEEEDEFIPELGTTITKYNYELEEAVAEVERGEFYTHTEVTAHIQQWIHNHTK